MGASAKPWINDDAIRNLQEQEEQQPQKSNKKLTRFPQAAE